VGARVLVLLLAAGFAVAVVPASAADQSVTARNFEFAPNSVTISQGETVTWSNSGGYHNVKFDDGSFTDPPTAIAALWTVSRTFDTPGTFRYYCTAHGGAGGSGMSGTVVVNASGTGTAPGTSPGSGQAPGSDRGPMVSPLSKPKSKAKCLSRRRFRIRLRERRGERLESARVTLNGKPLKVIERRLRGRVRQTAEIDLRGVLKGTYTARIRAVAAGGKVIRGVRVYRTCASKRTPRKPPTL
jgi:plastocyanin